MKQSIVMALAAIYHAGFKNYQLGYASAMAIVLFVIVLLVSVIQRRALGKES